MVEFYADWTLNCTFVKIILFRQNKYGMDFQINIKLLNYNFYQLILVNFQNQLKNIELIYLDFLNNYLL